MDKEPKIHSSLKTLVFSLTSKAPKTYNNVGKLLYTAPDFFLFIYKFSNYFFILYNEMFYQSNIIIQYFYLQII